MQFKHQKRYRRVPDIRLSLSKILKTNIMEIQIVKLLKAASATLIILISISITFNSGLFVYSSLSNTLFFSALTSLLALITSIYAIYKTSGKGVSIYSGIICFWGIYILLHCYYMNGEYYRSLYLISSIIYLLTASYLIRIKIINVTFLKNILLSIAFAQLLFMIGQSLNFIEPYSKYFPISGTNENPNVNAIFLLCCLPIIIERIKSSKKAFGYKILLGCILLFLFILKCRTAYIGGAIILLTYFLSGQRINQWWRKSNFTKRIMSLSLLFILLFSIGTFLYQLKKNSADGRLLIWELSTEMIAENPIKGYGYGLFERNYNLKQASYFANQTTSSAEGQNASLVAMAYNDYLEQAIEGGVFGFLFYLGFFITLGYLATKQKDKEALSIILAIAGMALFNFIYAAIPIWFLLLNYGAILFAIPHNQFNLPFFIKKVLSLTFCCIAAVLLYHQYRVINAQTSLKKSIAMLKENKAEDAQKLLKPFLEQASTSEAFITQYANSFAKQKQYKEAIFLYKEASLYTSNVNLYYRMADCYKHLSEYDEALETLRTIAFIIPTNLRSRYQILCLQRHIQDINGARHTAQEIINISPKVVNGKSIQYKKQAKEFLEQTK